MSDDVTLVGPLAGAPPWLHIARGELGQSEIAGERDNPRIRKYHAITHSGDASDEVPWCASFVSWCLEAANVRSLRTKSAGAYVRFGEECGLRVGAIVVLHRSQDESSPHTGNHVTFLLSWDVDGVRCLGGNQGNRVSVAYYPWSRWRLKALRWPKGNT